MARRLLLATLSLVVPLGCSPSGEPPSKAAALPATEQSGPAGPSDPIALATSAAPPAVSAQATVVEFQADGSMKQLRAGSNGWLCVPDDPNVPGPDPGCMDATWQTFFDAFQKKETPKVDRLGVAYMLRGAKTASNRDPFATAPAAGESWLDDPPHIMLLVPDPKMLAGFSTDPNNGGPYVMWSGTPYAHLMVPIAARPSGS